MLKPKVESTFLITTNSCKEVSGHLAIHYRCVEELDSYALPKELKDHFKARIQSNPSILFELAIAIYTHEEELREQKKDRCKIAYQQLHCKSIEIFSYFTLKAAIHAPGHQNLLYTINGGKRWTIVGLSKGALKQAVTTVDIQGFPLEFGRAKVPSVELWRADSGEKVEAEANGDTQVVVVSPGRVMSGGSYYEVC